MSQVIIVSNRLPVSVKKQNGKLEYYPSIGGLATGLASYVNDRRNTWIGWPGIASDEVNDEEKQAITAELVKHNCNPVWLTRKQIDDFYNGYSNQVLWPLFHNLRRQPIKDEDKRRRWWQAYRSVNHQFTEVILNLSESRGHVWVHDYQLLLVPGMLRTGRSDISIGLFLHIPFPAAKTFDSLYEHKKLLSGMLGADVIGFHTPDYVRHFVAAAQAAGVDAISQDRLVFGNRVVRVGDFPMGIDYEKYASSKKSRAVRAAARIYKRRYKKRKLIVAVDRLDPSKGLIERLKAYQFFLEQHPGSREKVVFCLVAAPSRTDVPVYKNLAKRLSALVAEINHAYGTPHWQPVDYIDHAIPFEEVTALFQIADVAFIAPLRDGMNLVAKEFVASNRRRGALILSETAGAAEELHDALIVNPRQPESSVEALQQALTMRPRELRGRLRRMQRQLSLHTVQHWAKDFVTALQQPMPGTRPRTHTLRKRSKQQLKLDYRRAHKRLLLLDYDGSLVPFAEDFHDAMPPKSLINLLKDLARDPRNDLVIISGRSPDDLGKWFSKLSITLVAEHGASIKKAGNKTWRTIERADTHWKRLLLPALEKYANLTPGARVETKPHSLVWHYRGASPYHAQKYAVIIKRGLKPLFRRFGLELLQGNKVLEIKNPRVSKGAAAQPWLELDYDFILAFGDDTTDEELFIALPIQAWSIKVGHRRTAARFRVGSHRDVLSLLKKLATLT